LIFYHFKKTFFIQGLIFGYAKAAMFFGYGVTLFYGGVLVTAECLPYEIVFLVVNAVIGGAEMIGFSFAFTSDFNRAVVAGGRVMALLDRRPAIDGHPAAGLRLAGVAGNVALSEAEFFYESRYRFWRSPFPPKKNYTYFCRR
jgi:ATP-binding cassette subfamily B (MDR/TAP) protein 1